MKVQFYLKRGKGAHISICRLTYVYSKRFEWIFMQHFICFEYELHSAQPCYFTLYQWRLQKTLVRDVMWCSMWFCLCWPCGLVHEVADKDYLTHLSFLSIPFLYIFLIWYWSVRHNGRWYQHVLAISIFWTRAVLAGLTLWKCVFEVCVCVCVIFVHGVIV